MKFTMHCFDYEGQREKRSELNAIHKKHLENSASYGVKILIAGPLLASADENDRMGALYIIEAKEKAEVLKFFQDDPFWKYSVWNLNTVKINGVKLSVNSFI